MGHFWIAGSSRPIPCQPGTVNPFTGQSSCPTTWAQGTYSFLGSTAWVDWPANFACRYPWRLPIRCPMGSGSPIKSDFWYFN